MTKITVRNIEIEMKRVNKDSDWYRQQTDIFQNIKTWNSEGEKQHNAIKQQLKTVIEQRHANWTY